MKIKRLLLTILLLGVTTVFAAPFKNIERTLTQPDGTLLHCFISGDEFYNRLHDADGYTIVQAPNGFFVYATTDENGDIVPTEHIAGQTDPKAFDIRPNIKISNKEYLKRKGEMKLSGPKNRSSLNHGVYNNLVVYIKFKGDDDLATTKTKIESMLNSDGYYDVSMNNFFKKATYNQMSMQSYSFPEPEGEKLLAYEDIYPRDYYLPYNETTNPSGYVDHLERGEREFSLLERAIEFIADDVPDTLNIDRNNDGLVDNVIFIVKGNVSEWSSLLWPHCWEMGLGHEAYINGKMVYSFNFQLETASQFTISALCHEMSHSLGLPDLYHYSDSQEHLSPVGIWDLMSDNTEPPQHTSTYMKYKYGTWIDEIQEIGYGTYTIEANSWEGGRRNCYKIRSQDPDQFYLIEYRNNKSLFEQTLPNGGLLIYRIDTRFDGCINYDGETIFDEVYIFRPNGSYINDGNISNAAFSQEADNTVFNHTANPYPFLNKNTIDKEINICNISSKGDNMTFTYCPINTESTPQNLIVNVIGNQQPVELRWQAVESAESYNIYRDDILLASNVTDNHYQDEYSNITPGYHTYHVTSNINGEESYRSNEEFVIIGDYCKYTFDMATSGENGWQGGEIKAYFDNGMDDIYYTIYNGKEMTRNIVMPVGTKMVLYWLEGWNDSECSFTVRNSEEEIYTSSVLKTGVLKRITGSGTAAVAPKNLTAAVEDAGVKLSWTSFVETESFSVMRDGEVIAENIKGHHFTDKKVTSSGIHDYRVIANNMGHTSEPSEAVSISVMTFNQANIDLKGEIIDSEAIISWNTPAPIEGIFRYDEGSYITNVGSNTYNWGIKITADNLSAFESDHLSHIEIYDNYDGKYTFKIYNGSQVHDSTLLYSEVFYTTAANDFVRFELSEKVNFDSSKDLWIVAKASGGKGAPIPCGQFCKDPNSNLIRSGNSWMSATKFDIPYTWLLRAYTSSSQDKELTYNIYRQEEMIASGVKENSYNDAAVTEGVYYKVEALYRNIIVAQSNELCPNKKKDNDMNTSNSIYPNPAKDILHIKASDIRNITIVSTTGDIVFCQDMKGNEFNIDIRHLNSGVYIVRVSTDKEMITEKIVLYNE